MSEPKSERGERKAYGKAVDAWRGVQIEAVRNAAVRVISDPKSDEQLVRNAMRYMETSEVDAAGRPVETSLAGRMRPDQVINTLRALRLLREVWGDTPEPLNFTVLRAALDVCRENREHAAEMLYELEKLRDSAPQAPVPDDTAE